MAKKAKKTPVAPDDASGLAFLFLTAGDALGARVEMPVEGGERTALTAAGEVLENRLPGWLVAILTALVVLGRRVLAAVLKEDGVKDAAAAESGGGSAGGGPAPARSRESRRPVARGAGGDPAPAKE